MPRRATLAIPLLLALAAGSRVAGAEERATQRVSATRADVGQAYLRFERTLQDHPPAAADVPRVSDEFDRATRAFFLGRRTKVARHLDALTLSLLPAAERTPARRAALALKVRITPPVWPTLSAVRPKVRLEALYEAPAPEGLCLRLRPLGGGPPILEQDLPPAPDPEGMPLALPQPSPAPGGYAIEFVTKEGAVVEKGRWAVVTRPLGVLRADHERRLAKASDAHPALADAVACCRARNALLSDDPSESESAAFLHLGTDLAGQVAREVAAIEVGRNPYAGHVGDLWRSVPHGSRALRFRQVVPPRAEGEAPYPLVVALHGLGGDENVFVEAYGAGLLKRLALERRFVLVAPRTTDVGFDAQALDRLVAVVASEQPLDGERIYVLGHSLGAGVTTLLARQRPEVVRAGCAIAGVGQPAAEFPVPLLVVKGGRDRVIPALQAPEAGREGNVEVRVLEAYGHTLVVPAALPDVVDWLLDR